MSFPPPDRPQPYQPREEGYGYPQDQPMGTDPRYPQGYGDDGAPQGRGGFRAFPFPSYQGRTRGGVQYAVGGCCLPLPLGCLTTVAAAGAIAAWRATRRF